MLLMITLFVLMICFNVHNEQHPRLLRLLLSEKISVQTIIILDKVLSFIKDGIKTLPKRLSELEKSFKIKKLSPFIKFNLTKCKFIMKEIFV